MYFTKTRKFYNLHMFERRQVMIERTLVLIKPDGMERKLIGRIIGIYEEKGLEIAEIKSVVPTRVLLEKHYAEHKGKEFFLDLLNYMSHKVIAMIVQGENAIELVRKINGKTDPLEAEMGSIRGMHATSRQRNIVHASDSKENADREIALWFE